MSYPPGSVCVMCGRAIYDMGGRATCKGCDLPTDCCLCEDQRDAPAPPKPSDRIRRSTG